MVKTEAGGWASYKKLVKKPDQIKGRKMLRKAVDDAVKALDIMWDSEYKTRHEISGDDIQAKYANAAYYIFKYLAETKQFDPISELHGYMIHMLWRREDGTWILQNNDLDDASRKIARFVTAVGLFMQKAYTPSMDGKSF